MNPTVIGLAVCAKVRSGATASSVPAPTILEASANRRRREICLVMMLSPHSALVYMPRPTIRPGSVGAVNWAGRRCRARRGTQEKAILAALARCPAKLRACLDRSALAVPLLDLHVAACLG